MALLAPTVGPPSSTRALNDGGEEPSRLQRFIFKYCIRVSRASPRYIAPRARRRRSARPAGPRPPSRSDRRRAGDAAPPASWPSSQTVDAAEPAGHRQGGLRADRRARELNAYESRTSASDESAATSPTMSPYAIRRRRSELRRRDGRKARPASASRRRIATARAATDSAYASVLCPSASRALSHAAQCIKSTCVCANGCAEGGDRARLASTRNQKPCFFFSSRTVRARRDDPDRDTTGAARRARQLEHAQPLRLVARVLPVDVHAV